VGEIIILAGYFLSDSLYIHISDAFEHTYLPLIGGTDVQIAQHGSHHHFIRQLLVCRPKIY